MQNRVAGEDAKEQIRNRINIVTLVERHVKLKPSGRNFKGLCPFHKEKTPSFVVSPDRGTFHCFGCNKGGDIFTFVQEIEGVDFREALEMLAEEAGVRLSGTVPTCGRQAQSGPAKTEMIRVHALATEFFYSQVKGNERVVSYLRERGLKPETVREFRLGYAPNAWRALIEYLSNQGIGADTAVACGLAVAREGGEPYDRFRDRLMFPLYDAAGRVVAFAGRSLGMDVEPKYLNSPETAIYRKSRLLYGLHKSFPYVKEQNDILVVEGYMDYLALYEAGIRNVVATAGTALTADHAQLLRRYASRVTLVFDGDRAGIAAAERALFALAPAALDVRVLLLPEELDPDEYVRTHGPDAFRSLVAGATEGFEFLLDRSVAVRGCETPQAKSAVLGDLAPFVSQISDTVVHAEYVRRVAERLRISERLVSQRLRSSSTARTTASRVVSPAVVPARTLGTTPEGYFIKLLLHYPQEIERVLQWVSPAVLTDTFSRELYSLIVDVYKRDSTLRTLLDAVSEEQKRVIAELTVTPPVVQEPSREVTHVVVELQKKYVRFRLREITTALRKNPGDSGLLEQQRQLTSQLRRLMTGKGSE